MDTKHVASLEMAKKLKDSGWDKLTLYRWHYFKKKQNGFLEDGAVYPTHKNCHYEVFPAPLASEILEELPDKLEEACEVNTENMHEFFDAPLIIGKTFVEYQGAEYFADNNLCDALAKMALYLHKEGIIKW